MVVDEGNKNVVHGISLVDRGSSPAGGEKFLEAEQA